MEQPLDHRFLGVIERLTVPVVLLVVLGTVGFFGTASVTPLSELFWYIYAGLWIIGLLFIVWFERRPSEMSTLAEVDPVDILEARYAAGELDEQTFEGMLDTLLDERQLYPERQLEPDL